MWLVLRCIYGSVLLFVLVIVYMLARRATHRAFQTALGRPTRGTFAGISRMARF